jgi:hypothetical protein
VCLTLQSEPVVAEEADFIARRLRNPVGHGHHRAPPFSLESASLQGCVIQAHLVSRAVNSSERCRPDDSNRTLSLKHDTLSPPRPGPGDRVPAKAPPPAALSLVT